MTLEMEVQLLRRAILDLTNAILQGGSARALSEEDEVVHIEVITPTIVKDKRGKHKGRPSGIVEQYPRKVCRSSCCGTENAHYSDVKKGCRGCVQ